MSDSPKTLERSSTITATAPTTGTGTDTANTQPPSADTHRRPRAATAGQVNVSPSPLPTSTSMTPAHSATRRATVSRVVQSHPTAPGPPKQHAHLPSSPVPGAEKPPPIFPPDVISVFDPASAGGGGPLTRITTQRSIRQENEARERAAREAQGLPAEEGIIGRLRSIRKKPHFAIDPHHEHHEEDEHEHEHQHGFARHVLGSNWSTRSGKSGKSGKMSQDSPMDEKAFDVDGEQGAVTATEGDDEEYVYPDGGYGWVVVVCCMTLSALTMGWGMCWGVFQDYITTYKIFPANNQAVLSLVGMLAPATANAVSFFFGRMGDSFGFKKVLIVSAFLGWAALFISAFATNLAMLMVFNGVMLGIAQGMALPLFMSLPSQWFFKRRGAASGLAIGGAGLGGGISVQILRPLLTHLGWKKTMIIISFVNFFFWITAAMLIRTRPASPEAGGGVKGPWFNRELFKSPSYWAIAVSLLVGVPAYGVPFTFVPTWLTLKLPDLNSGLKGLPSSLIGFSICIGRPMIGLVADWIGPINTYILVFVLAGAVQLALWLTATSFAQICVFSIVFGLVAPGFIGLIPQIVVQLFGPTNLASNVGMVLLFLGPPNMLNGPIGGALYDASGKTTLKWVIVTAGVLQMSGGIIAMYAKFKTSRRLLDVV